MPEPIPTPEPSPATPGDPGVLAAQDRFVEAWGKMGSVWGISRTMAEVHALLYISGEPLCTDDIMDRLQISRGNASMSMRALLDWGVVKRAHKRGDRKEYFEAEQDVWTIFRAIVRERMKREVDPCLASLHEIRDEMTRNAAARGEAPARQGARGRKRRAGSELDRLSERLDAMLEFFELATRLGQRFTGPTGPGLQIAATILSKTPHAPNARAAEPTLPRLVAPEDAPGGDAPPEER